MLMETRQYKLPIRKFGGSLYCLIPQILVKKLNIKNDKEVLVDFKKSRDIVRETCEQYRANKTAVFIAFEKTELIGFIEEVSEEYITFYDSAADKHYVIELTTILELEPTKPEKKINDIHINKLNMEAEDEK